MITNLILANSDFGSLGAGMVILYLAILVLVVASWWVINQKAGKPGWAAIIPIYNIIVELQIAKMNPWLVLLMFVPIANVVVLIMMYINIARLFGKGVGYALGLIFLNIIFLPMLAFGPAKYQG
jgi:hypothetical protein